MQGLVLLVILLCVPLSSRFGPGYAPAGAIRDSGIHLSDADADLNIVRRLMLQNYLAQNAAGLQEPAGMAADVQDFVIPAGTIGRCGGRQILTAAGLLNDPELFLNYLRYYGLRFGPAGRPIHLKRPLYNSPIGRSLLLKGRPEMSLKLPGRPAH